MDAMRFYLFGRCLDLMSNMTVTQSPYLWPIPLVLMVNPGLCHCAVFGVPCNFLLMDARLRVSVSGLNCWLLVDSFFFLRNMNIDV